MRKHFVLYADRKLMFLLLPEAIDDYVGSDNPVRFIDAFVEGLDLFKSGFARVEPKATGRPGYAPGDLLKLYIYIYIYIYGYLNRVRSSRRLEAECHRNVELIRLKPDFKTISDFRAENRAAFKSVFRQFALLCKRLDLFGRQLLAVDGTRIKAVNNKDRNFTRRSLEAFIKAADQRLDDYLQRLDEDDAAEAGTSGARVENLAKKIEALREKRGRYGAMLADRSATQSRKITLPKSMPFGRGPSQARNNLAPLGQLSKSSELRRVFAWCSLNVAIGFHPSGQDAIAA